MKNMMLQYQDQRRHNRSGGLTLIPFSEVDKGTHMALGYKGKGSGCTILPEIDDEDLFTVFTPNGDARYLVDR